MVGGTIRETILIYSCLYCAAKHVLWCEYKEMEMNVHRESIENLRVGGWRVMENEYQSWSIVNDKYKSRIINDG